MVDQRSAKPSRNELKTALNLLRLALLLYCAKLKPDGFHLINQLHSSQG